MMADNVSILSQPMQGLSVVIPIYNECQNIEILVPDIQRVFKENELDGEIIVVDDQSNDGSWELLCEMKESNANLHIYRRNGVRSLSESWHFGFSKAGKEVIVCVDGDLCHDPEEFPRMLKMLSSVDIVIGSRYLQGGMMIDKSFFARIASYYGRHVTRLVSGVDCSDPSHSFRMFKSSVFETISSELETHGNVYLVHFLVLAKREQFTIGEVPIKYGRRLYGETKLNLVREVTTYLLSMRQLFHGRKGSRRADR